MIQLGTTHREVFSKLGTEEAETLLAEFKKSFAEFGELFEQGLDVESALDTSTDDGDFSIGGFYFLVETDADIAEMIERSGCSDVRDTPTADTMLFDVAGYLNKAETVAQLMLCSHNGGGDVYIIKQELMEEYPSIREFIFKTNEQADGLVDFDAPLQ